jgi:hypothetical protein
MINGRAMQAAESLDADKKKVRHIPSDVNRRQMSMGSWHANLSKGGLPRLGRVHGTMPTAVFKGAL